MAEFDKLNQRKANLTHFINEQLEIKENYSENIKKINSKIGDLEKTFSKLKLEKEKTIKNLDLKTNQLSVFKQKIEEYKNTKKQSIKQEKESETKIIIDKINNLKFKINSKIFLSFEKLETLKKDFIFANKLEEIVSDKILELKNKLFELSKKNFETDPAVSFYYFKLMVEFENYFKEDIFSEYFFNQISDKFTFHFLTNRETNRLDKPEWLFKFLTEELNHVKKIFNLFKKDLKNIISKIKDLIAIKIRELLKTSSLQKRELICHFWDEYLLFSDIFQIKENFSEIEIFLEFEEKYLEQKIISVHEQSFIKWHLNFKKLVEEYFLFILKYYKLDFKVMDLLVYLLEKIYQSYEVLVNEMRFSNVEEIKFFCKIYSQIEEFKFFLDEKELDLFVLNLDLKLLHQTKCKFFILNQENLKVLKDLFDQDLFKLLRKIKGFNSLEDDLVVTFCIDLSNILQIYKCTSFDVFKRRAKSKIDLYLINEIFLQLKLISSHVFKMKVFIKNLNEFFDFEVFEASKYLECVECIFEDVEYTNNEDIYIKIKKLYE